MSMQGFFLSFDKSTVGEKEVDCCEPAIAGRTVAPMLPSAAADESRDETIERGELVGLGATPEREDDDDRVCVTPSSPNNFYASRFRSFLSPSIGSHTFGSAAGLDTWWDTRTASSSSASIFTENEERDAGGESDQMSECGQEVELELHSVPTEDSGMGTSSTKSTTDASRTTRATNLSCDTALVNNTRGRDPSASRKETAKNASLANDTTKKNTVKDTKGAKYKAFFKTKTLPQAKLRGILQRPKYSKHHSAVSSKRKSSSTKGNNNKATATAATFFAPYISNESLAQKTASPREVQFDSTTEQGRYYRTGRVGWTWSNSRKGR